MRKSRKIILVAGGLFAVAVLVLWLAMDYIARRGIERTASSSLGVRTELASVSIKPFRSSITISGLKIGNPEGYKSDNLLTMKHAMASAKISSLLSSEMVVHEVIIESPELTFETKPGIPPKNNLGDLLAMMKTRAPTPEERAAQQHYRIGLIRVTGTRVRVHGGKGVLQEATLPDIELRDISNADGTAVVMADVLQQVLAAMTDAVLREAKGILPKGLLSTFNDIVPAPQR
ncbi:MAG TPA: hypothetical protein VM141_10575 [Planctomycetota bacterium]|nr:hypothetical protein [Planctomycetota bacterium]